MFVRASPAGLDVVDPDDCTSLDVRVDGADRPELAARLTGSGLGEWDGSDHVALDVGALHDLAQAGAVGPDWPARWDAMLGYAAKKGWLSDDGTAVRAHLVTSERQR
jgi:hypothetical protein